MEPLIFVGILLGFTHLVAAYEVTLLDTTQEAELGWQTYKGGGGREWVESSWNTDSGESLRAYQSCNVDAAGVNNWLRMPYIARSNANRLYIEIRFTMRKCNLYPEPDRLLQCKESFKLLYYEAATDFANAMMPTWDTYTYKDIDVIAADTTFSNLDDIVINYERREIPITKDGVYFAFYDTGACTTLLSVRVYYIVCLSITANYAIFPNTTTGAESSSFVQQQGTCVPHAAIEEKPTFICSAKGEWSYSEGGCKCMPGYEPDSTKKQCAPCKQGTYKWATGDDYCDPCPPHSEATIPGSVECDCMLGYYRNINDEKSMACTQPPTAPQNLTVTFHDQSMVNLSWDHPADTGGRKDFYYGIDCLSCGHHVSFYPKKHGFNATRASVMGLNPETKYKLIIYVENGVTHQSGARSTSAAVITTEASIPSKVAHLHISSAGLEYIGIAWEPPSEPHSKIEKYEVRFFIKLQEENASSVYTRVPNATFRQLQQETEYCFKVRGKTQKGWGEFSHPICTKTGHRAHGINKVDTQSDNPVGIIAGSAVAVVVCMIIVIIMVVIFLRRNHRGCSEKNVSDCDTLQYSNVQCPHVLEPGHVMNGGLTMPLFMPPGGIRTYIDPHTYEDPNQAVREFTKEIDAACITIESVIGGGEFGDVCKGRLRLPGKGELSVAIKTLKAGASDKNRLDFLTEASIMGQFDDPNVIYLEGVVTKSNPIMIVTEYMENGSLDTFLRNNDGKFTVIQLVGMMRGIASGMRYLAEMGYVHRDLAARNILANENLVCKVADFGLSREIESDDTDGAYTTKGGKIPVRWTAPEAIAYRKFTSASDVWSYGVVMWEVMSYGERPYWNWSNQDVIKAIEKGFRLPPPMDCPESIHQLMLDCWQKERSHRPKFTAIVKTLDKLIRAPELLRKIAKPRPYQFLDPSTPDYTRFDSIEEWLSSIKMERYVEHFVSAGYCSMEQVAQITLKDLTNLGVMLVGHQKKIMNSVQTMRAQLAGAAQVSEGFMV